MASSSCNDLFGMKNGDTCTDKWKNVRDRIHPSQEAVGYSAVKRKVDKDYKTEKKAQKRMDQPGSLLPFVLGPNGVPYLIDSHHTTSALEASGHHDVQVTLQKICDWSDMEQTEFHQKMKNSNFMVGIGRPNSEDPNSLPVPIDVTTAIPPTIMDLMDDPWRSFAALVRKVKDDDCPSDNKKCLRGYFRECKPDGSMTAFFEFRWAYFMNEAYNTGCDDKAACFWDSTSDCKEFERAYKELLKRDVGAPILNQDLKKWQQAAKLLVPLCRGTKAESYVLPKVLGRPMGGERLPGYVAGQDTQIPREDPDCNPPKCPIPQSLFAKLLEKMKQKD